MDEENKREKSNLELWAEDEVKIACARENPNRKEEEFDYRCACYESALKAFKSLCEDEHSGASIMFTKAILDRLITGKPLTSIDDTEDMWNEVYGIDDNSKHYQCKRMSSLFKDVKADDSVEYKDVNRFHGVNIANPHYSYHSGLIDTVMSELFPIYMPYVPCDKPYKVYTEDFLTDSKNGDFDTVGILYVITPQGDRIEINRYFKDGESDDIPGYAEIAKEEYLERKSLANERVKSEMKE